MAALAGGGNITFAGGTLQYSGSNAQDYSARIVGSTSPIAIDTNGSNVTFASSLIGSNAGGLTKIGNGVLTLTASNGYTGTTTISGGTLQVGNGLKGASIGGASGILDNATLVFNNADSTTISGVISGAGGLVKTGSGTLVLTASNTYGGPTLIQGGVLRLANTPIPSLAAAVPERPWSGSTPAIR